MKFKEGDFVQHKLLPIWGKVQYAKTDINYADTRHLNNRAKIFYVLELYDKNGLRIETGGSSRWEESALKPASDDFMFLVEMGK